LEPRRDGRGSVDGGVTWLARGVKATTAIEGNTLTETEVKQIVAEGTAPVGSLQNVLVRATSRNILQCRAVPELGGLVMSPEVALGAIQTTPARPATGRGVGGAGRVSGCAART